MKEDQKKLFSEEAGLPGSGGEVRKKHWASPKVLLSASKVTWTQKTQIGPFDGHGQFSASYFS